MFTGIVQGTAKVVSIGEKPTSVLTSLSCQEYMLDGTKPVPRLRITAAA